MAEGRSQLRLVSEGDFPWSVKHAIRGRLRIESPILRGDPVSCQRFRDYLQVQAGILGVETSHRIGSATIRYAWRKLDSRQVHALVQQGFEVDAAGGAEPAPDALFPQNALPLLAGVLLATPVLPPPLRILATLGAISPGLWESVVKLREGGGASRALDSAGLLLATLAGRYDTAQINNLMHHLGRKMEQSTINDTETRLRQHGQPPAPVYPVLRGGETTECPIQSLIPGDRLRLGTGDSIPLESLVIEGEAHIASGFTHDEFPVAPGHRVAGGSRLLEGELELVCLQAWREGTYARLSAFIEIAIRNREAHDDYSRRLADRLAPTTMMISTAIYGLTRDLARASAALQADFNAANTLVTPVSVDSTIAAGAAAGILYRGGDAIEHLATLDTLVLDRSGTLTRGEWHAGDVIPLGARSEAECRSMLGQLVMACCRQGAAGVLDGDLPPLANVSHAEIHTMQEHGLHLRHEGSSLGLAGLERAGALLGVSIPDNTDLSSPGLWFCLVEGGECAALVRFCDELSAGNVDALETLRGQGVDNIHLLTHEQPHNLDPALVQLPLDGLHTGLDELEKLHFIQSLVDKGHRVGVVSDGMFRAASDCVNICLGAAPDARPLDADLWLLRGGISSLARAHELAVHSAARLRRGHRISQASTGSMLVATSFDLLPPVVTALIGNAVTLDLVRRAKTTDTGDTI